MEPEKLGFWLNDWGEIDKKHRERRNRAVDNFRIFSAQNRCKN
jgi:hypothetical protein